MNFQLLSPTALAIAAGLTIPPLVALYFLKLKRQEFAISSTLLWRKAIEDLHVNSPFQKLRSSLLLLLQLLILLLAAFALGQPMFARERSHEETLILLIDQSASMATVEEDNETRLEKAKEEAKRVIDGMDEKSRAMVIAFCDRATMVSSFDTDPDNLKRKIDTIEQTDSNSTLSEAIALAEAYSQNLIIGGETAGSDVPPEAAAAPASVLVFTDGRIEDAKTVSPQRLDLTNMEIVRVGGRSDNVGIIAMDSRRNYERPEALQVFATVRNFSPDPVEFDATLYIDEQHVDVQSVKLQPGIEVEGASDSSGEVTAAVESADSGADESTAGAPNDPLNQAALPGSVAALAFDEIEFTGEGVVEVRLNIRDAIDADNRGWSVIRPPRSVDVLLVTDGNYLLEKLIGHLNVNGSRISPSEYEALTDDDLTEVGRNKYDLVIFDRHSTANLPPGNYFFWGSAPKIDDVRVVRRIEGEKFIDWNENHPILRHTNVGTITVFSWEWISVPDEAEVLIEGNFPSELRGETVDPPSSTSVLSYWSRDGRQYLVCAFPLFTIDEESQSPMLNSDWVLRWDFVTFVYDAIQYMSSAVNTGSVVSLRPGEPRNISVPDRTDDVTVIRPDGVRENIPTGGGDSVVYARTRRVGVYQADPTKDGESTFAVNLQNATESCVLPADAVEIGSSPLPTVEGESLVNEPIWKWVVLGLLGILMLEWLVYNRRVFV